MLTKNLCISITQSFLAASATLPCNLASDVSRPGMTACQAFPVHQHPLLMNLDSTFVLLQLPAVVSQAARVCQTLQSLVTPSLPVHSCYASFGCPARATVLPQASFGALSPAWRVSLQASMYTKKLMFSSLPQEGLVEECKMRQLEADFKYPYRQVRCIHIRCSYVGLSTASIDSHQ